jgi:hypothetical protein
VSEITKGSINLVGATVTGMWFLEGYVRPPRPTVAQAIYEAANGEVIEAVVIGQMYVHYNDDQTLNLEGALDSENIPDYERACRYKLLTWDEARPMLAQYPDDGFPSFMAWTKSRVIFGGTYDGDDSVRWMPRNPEVVIPIEKIGG